MEDNVIDSTIVADDLVKYYKNSTPFEVHVYDENKSELDNTFVDFTINGNTYKREVTNGTAKLNINLNPGTYQITSKNCYDNTTIKNKITVLSTILCDDLTKYYKNDSQFYMTILDNQGNPQPKVNINVNINGVFYKRTSNANGTAKLNINLNPGTYTLTVEREDTKLKTSNTVKVLSTLICYDLTKYYGNTSYATVKALDDYGNPLKNASITFNINGVTYIRKSNDEGITKLNINLAPGDYILTAEHPNTLKRSANIKIYLN